jgi:CubicO group peptidase (beta-lactamase class C family)
MDEGTFSLTRRRLLEGAAAGVVASAWLGARPTAADAALRRSTDPTVSGTWHPRFTRVRDAFAQNFAERGEVGASVCVMVGGKTVVDLWGGLADVATNAAWQEDTLSQIWSSTKGATALCAHILVDRGELDLAAPVTTYWPEFGQNGKGATTVAMLLAHQAGVPAVRAKLPANAFYDWDFMTSTLATEAPFWEPGTRNGYHALTFGFLVGELVRRISGRSLGTFFRDEVATPLGLDFFIGLPESEDARVAPGIAPELPKPGDPVSVFFSKAFSDPTSIPALAFFNTGGYTNPGESDSRAAYAAEIGASGGITNARGLAHMYAPLAGQGRVTLVSDDTRRRMARVVSATGQDATGYIPTRFGLGYVKSMDNRTQPPGQQDSVILGEEAFGHSGFGGSIGFADPRAEMSFGYTMSKMGFGTALNARGQALVDAVYESLGYDSNASGSWARADDRGGRRRRR